MGKFNFNLRNYRHAIFLSAFVVLSIWGILFWRGFFKESKDHLMFFGFSATTTSILVAVLQSIRTQDWNRRHAAKIALKEFREKTSPHLSCLNATFNFYLRDENNVITTNEIHDAICKKDDKGQFLKCTVDHSKLMLDPDKTEINTSIREYLNFYEDIASGVHQGVYDKEVVADLMASSFIKVANLFGPYILHFNEMYPSSKGRVWLNLKTLGEDFKKKYRNNNYAETRDKT